MAERTPHAREPVGVAILSIPSLDDVIGELKELAGRASVVADQLERYAEEHRE